jgi:hypothetical protein
MCGVQHSPEKELFDTCTDPMEDQNIASDNTEIVSNLVDAAESILNKYKSNRANEVNEDAVEYDDEEEVYDRLKALGYK